MDKHLLLFEDLKTYTNILVFNTWIDEEDPHREKVTCNQLIHTKIQSFKI